MKNLLIYFTLFISCTITSCQKNNEPDIILSAEAEQFINEFLDLLERHSINRYEIDWTEFRTSVFEAIPEAQSIAETYPGIQRALRMLEDNHSFYITSSGNYLFGTRIQCGFEDISRPSLPDNIGYVRVPGFSGSSQSSSAISFANTIQNQIREQDSNDLVGWVVDLRSNTGGNMWPMLAGIGPLLGEGIAGYFIDPDNNQTYWSYSDGASLVNGNEVTKVADPYEPSQPHPKIAVLYDNGIASSGEVMAISFIGRENTRSFGEQTCGLSTSNASFTLSDNSRLLLTTAYLADRNRMKYGIPIEPDENLSSQNAIQAAIDWIQTE